jgi:DNA-binding MarR family transcriptional regulator
MATGRAPDEPAFDALGREVRRLFHQLRASAEAIHEEQGSLPIAQRAVLESLHRDGAATVPALARARPVSRQHIQALVNALREAGLVETRPNPAHRRSPLVALTPAGRRRFLAMRARERRALATRRLPASDAEMRGAARVLRALRGHLAREWPAGR